MWPHIFTRPLLQQALEVELRHRAPASCILTTSKLQIPRGILLVLRLSWFARWGCTKIRNLMKHIDFDFNLFNLRPTFELPSQGAIHDGSTGSYHETCLHHFSGSSWIWPQKSMAIPSCPFFLLFAHRTFKPYHLWIIGQAKLAYTAQVSGLSKGMSWQPSFAPICDLIRHFVLVQPTSTYGISYLSHWRKIHTAFSVSYNTNTVPIPMISDNLYFHIIIVDVYTSLCLRCVWCCVAEVCYDEGVFGMLDGFSSVPHYLIPLKTNKIHDFRRTKILGACACSPRWIQCVHVMRFLNLTHSFDLLSNFRPLGSNDSGPFWWKNLNFSTGSPPHMIFSSVQLCIKHIFFNLRHPRTAITWIPISQGTGSPVHRGSPVTTLFGPHLNHHRHHPPDCPAHCSQLSLWSIDSPLGPDLGFGKPGHW